MSSRFLSDEQIVEFLNGHDYDLRKSGNGRWIDQKCTPDVVWSVSDFILEYVDNGNNEFTVSDIWQSDYAKLTVSETFSKPDTDEGKARQEYDKFFAQPISLLCYSGVLRDISKTSRHLYVIEDRDMLEYIAMSDSKTARFLASYIEKVMSDSGLYPSFKDFFDCQTSIRFNALKEQFADFYRTYTPIKKKFEPNRIFAKVLNPLAWKYKKKGAVGGYISSDIIKYADLMYNRDNFRDVYANKPKGMTRKEWLAQQNDLEIRPGYFNQMMHRAMQTLQKLNTESRNGVSELTQFIDGQNDNVPATQVHHIFPKKDFPTIRHYYENLIALTPNQHFTYAHPNNNTQIIDVNAQKVLLEAKTYSIQQNLDSLEEEQIYDFQKFLEVLSVGWDDDSVHEIKDGDYADVIHFINYHDV